uniref:BHLH domain-containing protein n=1 Tax=Caenorhabditis japonica TaxID=281687 RepID=A0A8R1DTF5_CAEJA
MFKPPTSRSPIHSESPPGAEEEIEPYVRRKRAEGGGRKKMHGLNEQEQNLLRNSINSRERRRMHELNDEFEALRECLPYPNEANSRRMSKANTLLLASNWIKQLSNANHKLTIELNAAHIKV